MTEKFQTVVINDPKDELIQSLKDHIETLKSENLRLQTELSTRPKTNIKDFQFQHRPTLKTSSEIIRALEAHSAKMASIAKTGTK